MKELLVVGIAALDTNGLRVTQVFLFVSVNVNELASVGFKYPRGHVNRVRKSFLAGPNKKHSLNLCGQLGLKRASTGRNRFISDESGLKPRPQNLDFVATRASTPTWFIFEILTTLHHILGS